MPNSIPSPASSTSTTFTTLPTPGCISAQPSPATSLPVDMFNRQQLSNDDVFSPLMEPKMVASKLPFGGSSDMDEQEMSQHSIPSISVEDVIEDFEAEPFGDKALFNTRRGSSTHVPPPIFLGNTPISPAGTNTHTVSDRSHNATKGPNTAGAALPGAFSQTFVEKGCEEDGDELPELASSPRRLNSNTNGGPSSPSWQSFDSPPSPYSPAFGKNKRNSLEIPSPLIKSRFEPTPTHGIHSRNLSLYFPQPGQLPKKDNDNNALVPSPEMDILIPSTVSMAGEKQAFGGTSNWSFGQPNDGSETKLLTPEVKRSKRRGHHHKHSLSHNFFSFLDPTQTNPTLSQPPQVSEVQFKADNTPAPVPLPRFPATDTSTPSLVPLPAASLKLDLYGKLLSGLSLLELVLGAGLWIEGQLSGWKCLAGVGYLVVFDALGLGVAVIARKEGGGWLSIRRPFGSSRYISLLYFVQSIFLAFAAVYIAKESLEQVILGSGAHRESFGGHGHETGTHSHHSHMSDEDTKARGFPHLLLGLAGLSGAVSGAIFRNHETLVNAVGSIFLAPSYLGLPFVRRWPGLMSNPFTLTVVGGCLGILISANIVPYSSLHTLDSLISLLLTLFTSALAYPPTVFFAHILLQTAPPALTPQMTKLKSAFKDIKSDRRVVGLGLFRCWSVGAGKGGWDLHIPAEALNKGESSTRNLSPMPSTEFYFQSSEFSAPHTASLSSVSSLKNEPSVPLVITLAVHVDPDVSDYDMLEVTKLAWNKLQHVVSEGEGEVSIQVKRGWEGIEET
ncbi:uncharacterized protein L203_104759 [Cryptococcus depauperatus CBS 7841]|uniref:Uncharacterized protein n=1 Tax=Cryptococcus depauperatus CBS 7841 TaxID=1295531 RepID=A0AAJ8JW66_9TREE